MRKKMKNAVVVILSLALAGAVLAGCGESGQSSQEKQQEESQSNPQEAQQDAVVKETETEAAEEAEAAEKTGTAETEETAEKENQATERYEDNFAVDSATAKAFAEKVKAAAADKDLEALADLTAFPVYVGLPDVDVVETREDFLNLGAEAVFTAELLKSIETADIENLQPSMAGFSVSDGGSCNINFSVVDGVLAINGINY